MQRQVRCVQEAFQKQRDRKEKMQLEHSETAVKRKKNTKMKWEQCKQCKQTNGQMKHTVRKVYRALLAETSMQTGVRDIRPAVRVIWTFSKTGGTRLRYLCCKMVY